MSVAGEKRLVCHVVYRFATGGLENGLVNLINHLPVNQYEHIIVTLNGHEEAFTKRLETDVKFFDLKKKPGKDFGLYLRAWQLFRKLKPDILHTRNLGTLDIQPMGWLAGIKRRFHGEHGWDINDPQGTVVKYQRLRWLVGFFIHRFIVLSREQEEYLLGKVTIPGAKIERICNGVDLDRFAGAEGNQDKGSSSHLKTKSGSNRLVIGCIGRLAPIKGHSVLIEAVRLLKQSMENSFELLLVGDGEERSRLERLVAEKNLHDTVDFLGDRADIPALMRTFDIFVLPSLAEGISNTILEAMASGLPVIATSVGGNADLVAENQTGLIVPANSPENLAEAMKQLMTDSDLRESFARCGKQRARANFSLSGMVERYHQVYQSL